MVEDIDLINEAERILEKEGVIYYEEKSLLERILTHRRLKAKKGNGTLSYTVFWLTPLAGDMRTALPRRERNITRYFFSNVLYGQSFKKRALSTVGKALNNVRVIDYITPRRSILIKPDATSGHRMVIPSYIASLAEQAGLDYSDFSYGVSMRGKFNANKVIFFLFKPLSEKPEAVIKMTRSPEFNYRLENEFRVLTTLQNKLYAEQTSYPKALFFGYHNELAVLCLAAVEGKPFRTSTAATPECVIANDGIEWIVKLGQCSSNKSAASTMDAYGVLCNLFQRFTDTYRLTDEEKEFLNGKISIFAQEERKFPVVFQHGDPGTWNMMVSDEQKVIVIDWEAGEPNGMPLWDLFYFFRTYASWVSRVRGSRDSLKNFSYHFLTHTPIAKMLETTTERYCRVIGLDKKFVEPIYYTCWMHRALKEATRLRADELQSGQYLNFLKLVLEQRDNEVLSRLFTA